MQQVTKSLVENAKKANVKIRGPVRLPNKHLRICCRRTPCGEGSKTWDNFEMTVFKRYIDLECPSSQIKEVTLITIPSGVEINVDFRSEAWSWTYYISSSLQLILWLTLFIKSFKNLFRLILIYSRFATVFKFLDITLISVYKIINLCHSNPLLSHLHHLLHMITHQHLLLPKSSQHCRESTN